MGCCNNKKEFNNKELPKEEMLSYVSIVTGLMDVITTGKLTTIFKNPAADELAARIVNVIDENKYLRAILNVMKPDVAVNEESFSISFGPGKQYRLTIPVTTEHSRQELIVALQSAIQKLEQTTPPETGKQLPLFRHDS